MSNKLNRGGEITKGRKPALHAKLFVSFSFPSPLIRKHSVPMSNLITPPPIDLGSDRTLKGVVAEQMVFSRYKLRQVLGRGGMGVVWRAWDQRLEREVALKFLPEEINADLAALDELKRETKRCLELTHRNIIRIYDFIEDKEAAAIAMEYVDGKTLTELRVEKETRVFEVSEIKAWIGEVCAGLHYAHQEVGVVHRDLKPTNLMLTSKKQVKIADFGIAQSMSDSMTRLTMRRVSSTSGTPAYMSPQQLGGESPKASDDVYAMGVTIFELLTSKPPFHTGDVSFQVRTTVAPSMTERRRELGIEGAKIPQQWEEAVAACLGKTPQERPANMLELAERLGLPTGMMKPAAAPKEGLTADFAAATATLKEFKARPFLLQRKYQLIGEAIIAILLLLDLFVLHPRRLAQLVDAPATPPAAMAVSTPTPVLLDEIENSVTAGKLATAREKLKQLDAQVDRATADQMNAQFQPALTTYQQEIDGVIAASRQSEPAKACRVLKTLTAKYPDDLDLQLALAEAQMRLPPDQDRLEARLKALSEFADKNRDFAGEPDLLATEARFTSELNELNKLQSALEATKDNSRELARLKQEKEIFEDRRVGRPGSNPFASALNFFSKGHGADRERYFETQSDKDEAIAEVQGKIDALEAGAARTQGARAQAELAYKAFMARVPWGTGDSASPSATAASRQATLLPMIPIL